MGGTLTKVDIGHGRGWLEAEAAKSQARIDRALGHPQQITEAGRSWEQQNEHWQHYLRFGAPIALHPDTPSIHQKGRAKDTDERDVALMNDHGWFQTVYRWVNGRRTLVEPWHFEYDPARDNHRNDPAPAGGGTAAPTFQEDDMIAARITDRNGVKHHAIIGNGYFRHLIGSDDPEWQKNVVTADDRWTDIPIDRLPSVLRTFACDLHIWDVRNGTMVVRDPLDGSVGPGKVWSVGNELRSNVGAVKLTSDATANYVKQLAAAKS